LILGISRPSLEPRADSGGGSFRLRSTALHHVRDDRSREIAIGRPESAAEMSRSDARDRVPDRQLQIVAVVAHML